MAPTRAPASLLPVVSIAEPGDQGQILAVSLQGTKLVYRLGNLTNISLRDMAAKLSQFKRGSKITLSDDQGASIAWTAETFGRNDASLGGALAQALAPDACGIQFTQRCILSKTGYASWFLRVTPPTSQGNPVQLQYDLKTTKGFEFTDIELKPGSNSKMQVTGFAKGLKLEPLRNGHGDPTGPLQQSFNFFSVAGSSDSVNVVVDHYSKDKRYDIRYQPSGWSKGSDTMHVGNGIVLATKNLQIRQSCLYESDGMSLRQLTAGIANISTQAIFENWNTNVAHRYYEALAADQLFSAVPELTCVEAKQPTWSIEFSLMDKYPLAVENTTWFRLDSDEEATDPRTTTDSEPGVCIASHARSVRMIPLDSNQTSIDGASVSNVTATLRMFKTQDGSPIAINSMTLETPENPTATYGWRMRLQGGGGPDDEQVVRAGGFELHIPKTVDASDAFALICTADYYTPNVHSPSLDPRVPQFECDLNLLPLRDVIPVGEDDLSLDQYAVSGGGPAANQSKLETEIQGNLHREGALVFRNPANPNKTTQDGTWHLQYKETAYPGAKQNITMSLTFTVLHPEAPNPKDESVVVLDRIPFTFAEVHFHPLGDARTPTGTVAEWNSIKGAWKYIQIAHEPSYLVLPPQLTAEEAVTEDTNNNYPQGLNDAQQPRMLLGTPTVITYKPDSQKNYVDLPWNLRRLLTDSSLPVSRLDYEMLYGLACNTSAEQMRLTEAATLFGDIRPGLIATPSGYQTPDSADPQFMNARLHWSRIYREYQTRLGLFVVQDFANTKDPSDFRDTSSTACQLRLNDIDPDSDTPAMSPYMTKSYVSSDFNNPDFKGGALVGVNNADIFRLIVKNRKSDFTHAAVIGPQFSALGGFGTTQARFDEDRSTLINTISMGRTVTYSVERIGRIACHWNRAKHVIVYERTVVPSRQFFSSQKRSKFPGIPLVRKVEEYVEILQKERVFAAESDRPQAAFVKGCKCGERTRIPVDSAWGSTVPGQGGEPNQGWKVPLWNPAAAAALPDVYPKPQFYLEVSTPEQTPDSTAEQPKFITQDCLLTRPQELFFFTSTVAGLGDDTDTWPAVDSVDRVGYPLLIPDSTIYAKGDLNATPLPEFSVPPGWQPVSFTVEPPASGVHATDGIVSTLNPIAAKLRTVTVSRGSSPAMTTIQKAMAAADYAAYAPSSSSLGGVTQGFGDLRNAIINPNATQRLAEVQNALSRLQTNCTNLKSQVPTLLPKLADSIQQSFNSAGQQLAKSIDSAAVAVNSNVTLLAAGVVQFLANPGNADHHQPWVVEAERIVTLIHATQTDVQTWDPNWTASQIKEHLNTAIQGWSAEVEQAIGSFSPLRKVSVTFAEFQQSLDAVSKKLNDLQTNPQPNAQKLLQSCQSIAEDYDNAVSSLASGVANLQASVQLFDASAMSLGVDTSRISGQFRTIVQSAVEAAACVDANQAQALVKATIASVASLQTTTFSAAKSYVDSAVSSLALQNFDLLQQSTTIQNLYNTTTLPALQSAINQVKPDVLLAEIETKKQAFIDTIRANSQKALSALSTAFTNWINSQIPQASAPWNNLLTALNSLNITLGSDFQKLQSTLDGLETGVQSAIDSTKQSLDQYVRQPLMQMYQPLAGKADSVMRVVRAFGDPPQVPHLDLQPPEVAYVYNYLDKKIPITPVLARANQVGQALNALGVTLPSTHLAEALVPADLKQFDLNKILPNFSGLNLGGLFSGIKLPEIANHNIVVTHGWEPQARRAWLQADVNVPIADRMVVFQAGFFAFSLSGATFKAHCKIQNDGTHIQQTTNGSISGKWSIELSESSSLIEFADTALIFDESGKLQFQFNPAKLKLADALQAVSALVQSFSDPGSGFSYGTTPNGVKCAFALPVPDSSALTSGFTGLSFSTSLELSYASTFDITLTLGVSSKNRPFNFAIFILGGCGYVEAGVTYHVDTKSFDAPKLDLAIGCSASLAIALGPISGGVYAQFAIELRNSGSGFRAGAFFQISGHVSLLGMVSIDIVLRLEATYASGVMTATGHVSYSIKLFMFSISVEKDVSMRLGSSGQSNAMVLPSIPRNEVAGLAGPDGFVPGMAAAFAAADSKAQTNLCSNDPLCYAKRYIDMLI